MLEYVGKCVNAAYTNGETVKTILVIRSKLIVVKLSYSTIKTIFFYKINDAMWGDLVEQA